MGRKPEENERHVNILHAPFLEIVFHFFTSEGLPNPYVSMLPFFEILAVSERPLETFIRTFPAKICCSSICYLPGADFGGKRRTWRRLSQSLKRNWLLRGPQRARNQGLTGPIVMKKNCAPDGGVERAPGGAQRAARAPDPDAQKMHKTLRLPVFWALT